MNVSSDDEIFKKYLSSATQVKDECEQLDETLYIAIGFATRALNLFAGVILDGLSREAFKIRS